MDPLLTRPAWLDIDLDAVERNYLECCRLAGSRAVIASVKADGYGHGAVEIARAVARRGCRSVWTGNVEEALAIRRALPELKVLLFGGAAPEALAELAAAGLVPTVCDLAGARAAAARGPAALCVKVDAGLGRLGVPLGEARETVRAIAALPGVTVEGLYTHLPFGDPAGRDWAAGRAEGFAALLRGLADDGIRPAVTQLWASAGLIAGLPIPAARSASATCSTASRR